MWPNLIVKAKEGGIDVIQTYVFWNLHEPHQGQVHFKLLNLYNSSVFVFPLFNFLLNSLLTTEHDG